MDAVTKPHMKKSVVTVAKAGLKRPLFKSDKDVPFGGEIVVLVIEAVRIGEQQPVIFHLLAPPVTGAKIALLHRAGGDVVDDGEAVSRAARCFHHLIMQAREL